MVSACIRQQIRRAAQYGYPPLFGTYELASVAPPADVPCMGIETGSVQHLGAAMCKVLINLN